ncbi:unnamed protein product [Rotaria sp. Silwood2]|nr:unnamed protein product [Rotaria sp. Silwood2]CAF4319685.1 unnamed protein product [Rotaria sp. Silwood2]
MSRRRTTSSSHIHTNQNPCVNYQNDPNIRSTSEIYKQAYQSLMNIECHHVDTHQNTISMNYHPIPPPHRNNLEPVDSPVNSPLRRPHSSSENDVSELEDFEHDPNTKTIQKNRKKTKINNNNNITFNNSNRSHIPASTNQPTLQQQHTNTTKLFAQSRYPFPPFIIRFPTPYIHEQKIVEELCKYLKENKQLALELSDYRKASAKCSSNECDLLLFVKNSYSFSILYDEKNWPQSILGLTYTRPSTPTIPPQLSLIIKNVSLSMDFADFTNEIKASYSNVRNVIRMKNKNQSNIKLVKLEFSEPGQRNEILNHGKIFVHFLTYDVEEYLAPARVLICSKCMGLGHFRKQCKQTQDTCKKSGQTYDDINNHTSTCTQLQCIHCQGNHMSNDMQCPKVKQFRADLTKFLLSPAIQANHQDNYLNLNSTNFPPLNSAQRHTIFNQNSNSNHGSPNTGSNNPIINKIDTLINSMNQVNVMLDKMVDKNHQFEQFMKDKNINDDIVSKKVDELISNDNSIKQNVIQHEIKITRYENILIKLIFPILDEISFFLSNINVGKHNGTLHADFKVKINRMRAQLNNARTDKDF